MIILEYLDGDNNGAGQIVVMRTAIFDPRHISGFGSSVGVSRNLQPKRHFLILAHHAYHGGFYSGVNVENPTNIADLSRIDGGRVVCARMGKVRPYQQCVILVVFVLRKAFLELETLIEGLYNNWLVPSSL